MDNKKSIKHSQTESPINHFLIDSEYLSPEALAIKHRLETDPSSRKSHMEYLPGMEVIESDIRSKVMEHMKSYDYSSYTGRDVMAALEHETCSIEDFKALLSPAAEPFLEMMAQRASCETSSHFGNTVYMFTPLYIANYCENYCVYCGFNCYNHINRMKLSSEQIEKEMKIIADSGMEEILILTGESRSQSDVKYIGEACKLARKYFRMVGLEIYPVNTDEYRYLHECGADYVTVFQETYDADKYETLHLMGHKRVWPYRFDAQERALMGGMRGVAFSALLGLSDFRKDALATALHAYFLQRKYPHAEISLSCPRLRPITCAVKHPRQQHQPLQARQTSAIFKTAYIFAICIDKIPQLLLCEVHRLAGILYSLPNNNTVQFFLLPIRPRGQQYYFTIKSQNKKPHPMRTFHIRCDF